MKPKLLLLATLTFTCLTAKAQHWSNQCNAPVNGFIMDITVHNGKLHVCGSVTRICDTPVNKVARFEQFSWLSMGNMTDDVHALRSIDNELYAAVYSTSENDSNWLYRWDGTDWQKFGIGFYLTTAEAAKHHFASVYDVVSYNNELYVCGEFDIAGGNPASGIAKWNGTEWEALNGGLQGTVNTATANIYPHKMLVYKNDLYVVGNFKEADGVTVNGVARWDGAQWHALGNGFNEEVYGIESYNDTLYVCGTFTASGANALGCVAKWDGTQWLSPDITVSSTLGGGYRAFGHTLKTIDNMLYMGGGFNKCVNASGININASNVMEYDGTRWSRMDGGTNGEVEGLAGSISGDVYVGGSFTWAGKKPINSLAIWDPSTTSVATLNKTNISIYPNPVTDKLVLEGLEKGTAITLNTFSGQVVLHTIATEAKTILPINKLAAGTYFLKISKDGLSIAQPITKQ